MFCFADITWDGSFDTLLYSGLAGKLYFGTSEKKCHGIHICSKYLLCFDWLVVASCHRNTWRMLPWLQLPTVFTLCCVTHMLFTKNLLETKLLGYVIVYINIFCEITRKVALAL